MKQNPLAGKRTAVISDIHLGILGHDKCAHMDHEVINRVLDSTKRSMAPVQAIVANGDIFEMLLTDNPNAVEDALKMLKSWLEHIAPAEFHYIFGNHDNCQEFYAGLKALQTEHPNLILHELHLEAGNMLFTHGDYGKYENGKDYPNNHRPFYPFGNGKLLEDYRGPDGQIASFIFKSQNDTTARATQVVNDLVTKMPEAMREVDYVCIGHSHRPFKDLAIQVTAGETQKTYKVYNTGSTLIGSSVMPIEIQFDADGLVATRGTQPVITNLLGYLPIIRAPNALPSLDTGDAKYPDYPIGIGKWDANWEIRLKAEIEKRGAPGAPIEK